MSEQAPAYGLWPLVFINSSVFIIFALSFDRPPTNRDWLSFGAFSAFLVALFTEMYGFSLTIYVMSGFLVQWPTLLTVPMFPVLVWMYARLARREERTLAAVSEEYRWYMRRVPGFFPRLNTIKMGPSDV